MANPTFAQVASATTGSSATTTHTLTASISAVTNGIGFFWIERNDGGTTDLYTGVTWGGVSMSPIASQVTIGVNTFKGYYVLNPVTGGSVTITATTSSNINARFWWETVQDAKQAAPEAVASFSRGTSTDGTVAVTTLTNNALVVGSASYRVITVATPSSGTTNDFANSLVWYSWHSPQATAGSNTSGNTNSVTSDNMGFAVSIPPIITANSGFFNFM